MNIYGSPTPYQADNAAGFYVFMGRQLQGNLTVDGPGPVVTFDDGSATPPVPPPPPNEGRRDEGVVPNWGDRGFYGG